MKRGLVFALAVGASFAGCGGCGEDPTAPEVIRRDAPGRDDADPVVATTSYTDYSDAGLTVLDGGCCLVAFVLPQTVGEAAAQLVFRSDVFAMSLDGGIWSVSSCVQPEPTYYYYQVGYPADEDAGMLWVERVNDGAPTSQSTSVAPEVNVFDAPAGATCATLDAGAHSQLRDAGIDGTADAGADGGSDAGVGDDAGDGG